MSRSLTGWLLSPVPLERPPDGRLARPAGLPFPSLQRAAAKHTSPAVAFHFVNQLGGAADGLLTDCCQNYSPLFKRLASPGSVTQSGLSAHRRLPPAVLASAGSPQACREAPRWARNMVFFACGLASDFLDIF